MIRFPPRLLCLCLPLALLVPARLWADEAAPTPAPALYKQAVLRLHEGHFFEAAMRELSEAVRQDPTNPAYHRALGDAEADRAGSLAYAAWTTDMLLNAREQYPIDLDAWQEAQKDPQSDDYGQPPPTRPPDYQFQTKDDLHYLRLTGKQAVVRIGELGRAAQAEWKQSITLAKTPGERAEMENAQGWGLLFLVRLLERTGYPAKKIPGAPTRDDAVKAFTAAVKDAPDKAEYWQGLGDAYPYDSDDKSHAEPILAAYGRALALGVRDPALRFRLFQIQRDEHPKEALATLRAAAASDPGNALLQWLLSEALFQQVHYGDVSNQTQGTAAERAQALVARDNDADRQVAQEALAALERGLTARDYYVPIYRPSVPKTLRRAWDYWNFWEDITAGAFAQSARMRNLARNAAGYADVAAREGNFGQAERAARDCIAVGLRLAGDWPLRDSSLLDSAVFNALVGVAIAAIGYNELGKVAALSGDPALISHVAVEAAAFKQRADAYRKAILEATSSEDDANALWSNY